MIQKINLKKYPKVRLLQQSTPIQYLERLSKLFGVDIYIKRDDLTEIGVGGNKLRKLEYLLGEAKSLKSTHILTLGALQSNHARLTAIAAAKLGYKPEVFLKTSVKKSNNSYINNGNLILERIIDAKIHKISADNYTMTHVESRMQEIRKEGGIPYFIPIGGSNMLGTLGYVDCFFEILQDEIKYKRRYSHIITASGSGGTHAGLMIGNKISKRSLQIQAYNVQPEEKELWINTKQIANQMLDAIGQNVLLLEDIKLETKYAGKAYGFPEDFHIDTIKLLAKTEGIFLDPVYTGKAFAGLIMDIENGIYKKGDKILFIHTGGIPGIFAYEEDF